MSAVSLQPPPQELLPSYSRPETSGVSSSFLPLYSNLVQQRQAHTYQLVKNSRQWLALSFRSQASSSDEEPRFHQGCPISGSVKLDLASEVVIRSVSVSVIGEITSPAYYSRFLTITRQLFVSDTNEIDHASPHRPTVFEGKLNGEHTFPFSIRLPKGVCILLPDAMKHNFRLPPSLINRSSKTRIHYRLVARVKKGMLSSDTRLTAEFAYTPLQRPSQPSILRQIAYLENQPLIGPDGDPEGWKSAAPVVVRGKIFNARSVEASCILSIARPLCYTRGTSIPLMLSISCTDAQALDLLSVPIAPAVQLVRHAAFSLHISASALQLVDPRDSQPDVVETATWWPTLEDAINSTERRVLRGELKIPDDAPPSCRIMNFALQYAVTLLGFRAVAFTPSSTDNRKGSAQSLHSEVVEIVTVPAQGPTETYVLPPRYDAA